MVSLDGSGAEPVAVVGVDVDVCAPAGNTAPTPIAAVPLMAAMAIIRFRFIVVPPLVVEPEVRICVPDEEGVNRL